MSPSGGIPGLDLNQFLQASLNTLTGQAPMATPGFSGNFDDMSDDQLLQLAGSMGLNTQDFMVGPPQGITDFNEAIPTTADVSQTIRDLVSGQYNVARGQGQRNVTEAAIAAAGRRGLNMTDTAMFQPLTRSLADLEAQLGASEANTVLGIGQDWNKFREGALLNRFNALDTSRQNTGRLNLGALGQQQNFNLNLGDFQQRLKQQAFQNRLSLGQTLGNMGVQLSGQRTGITPSTTQTFPPNVGGGVGLIGQGIQTLNLPKLIDPATFTNAFGQPEY